ncbi:hypothetical protein FRC03_012090 [Tulasnella sp. 419]|nr:hypothetical protein FRC03_012090 [Tulasnella sp. 419]
MAWQIMGRIKKPVIQDDRSPESPLHDYKHDLQSFFWVLLYICAGSPIFAQKALDECHASYEVMEIFQEPKRGSAFALKKVFLLNKEATIWVAEPFEAMLGVLSKMKALLSPEKWDDLTHGAFISILDEALQDPVVQKRALIRQHKFEPHYLEYRYHESMSTKADVAPPTGSEDEPQGSLNLVKPDASGSGSHLLARSRTRKHPSRRKSSASSSRAVQGLNRHLSSSVSRKRAADPPMSSRESKRSRMGSKHSNTQYV